MPSRRLDDRIRELCVQVVSAPEGEKSAIVKELRAAISEKFGRLRKLAAGKLLGGSNGHGERRSDEDE